MSHLSKGKLNKGDLGILHNRNICLSYKLMLVNNKRNTGYNYLVHNKNQITPMFHNTNMKGAGDKKITLQSTFL